MAVVGKWIKSGKKTVVVNIYGPFDARGNKSHVETCWIKFKIARLDVSA